jgi:hypothetical protein
MALPAFLVRPWNGRNFMTHTNWSSLRDQLQLADALFGVRGDRLVADWLDAELAKVDDPEYVRLFTDHVTLPAVVPADYAQRIVRTSRGALLGGIRFYGRDPTRPFVDVVAHGFGDLDALANCVRDEWSMFTTRFARLRARPGSIVGPRVLLDVSIHVARYGDMPPPDGRVSLAPFDDVEDAVATVCRRYERLSADDSALAHNVSPADPDDLRRWHSAGLLHAIRRRDRAIGLLAVAPGRIGWIEADEINEEVIDAEHAGRGHAASAQTAWARRPGNDAERLLVGTIDRLNAASRRTAERAGRPHVLDDVFLSL